MHPKRKLLDEILARSWAYLQVDGRTVGVDLPEWLREPVVTLQVGYDMPVPIYDLKVDDDGVVATLSFRRTPHRCVLPWAAIFAISDVDGKGVLFPQDVPAEVTEELVKVARELPQGEGEGAAAAAPPEPAADKPNGKKPRPSHLKLVP